MNRTIIENTDRFRLDSIGNGAAYEFTDKVNGQSKFIQYGDDAESFRAMYDAMAECYGDPRSVWHRQTWDACLQEVWNNA